MLDLPFSEACVDINRPMFETVQGMMLGCGETVEPVIEEVRQMRKVGK